MHKRHVGVMLCVVLLACADGGATAPPEPAAFPLASVSAGADQTCGASASGAAYCWGDPRSNSSLGHPATVSSDVPIEIQIPIGPSTPHADRPTFVALSVGDFATCGVSSQDRVYCWGSNNSGQLGIGQSFFELQSARLPLQTSGDIHYRSVSTRLFHACGVAMNGTVYCWGRGGNGQLGDGSNRDRFVPGPVAGPSFREVTTGLYHTCGVAEDGRAWCWGAHALGQLGNGTLPSATAGSLVPTEVSGGLSFTVIAAGRDHTCALTSQGRAYCWGSNTSGQIGDGSTTSRPTPTAVAGTEAFLTISAGNAHTCAVTRNGRAYCWGLNESGQLGNGGTESTLLPVRVSGSLRFAAISAAYQHTCALTAAGGTWCWGSNSRQQLGNPEITGSFVPAPVAEP
jgi:alpha-tubulin suppressor-like RCC1 family protein